MSHSFEQIEERNVSPNVSDYDSRTSLHLACSEGHANVVNLLIEKGADVNVEDRWG